MTNYLYQCIQWAVVMLNRKYIFKSKVLINIYLNIYYIYYAKHYYFFIQSFLQNKPRYQLHPLFSNIIKLVYPKLCTHCQKNNDGSDMFLCFECLSGMPLVGDYHTNNETEKIFWGRFDFGYAYSLLYFQKDNMAQNMIHDLKYKGREEVGDYIGYQLGKQLLQIPMAVDDNILLPVPLSAKKIAKRGFNQSNVIAQGICNKTNIPIAHNNLLRIKNTETQTRKSRFARYTNMSDAFEIDNVKNIEGKHIIIIDDVITTGATIESCAMALLKIPKVKVSVLCGAIAMH